jgi:hypothetical protein
MKGTNGELKDQELAGLDKEDGCLGRDHAHVCVQHDKHT